MPSFEQIEEASKPRKKKKKKIVEVKKKTANPPGTRRVKAIAGLTEHVKRHPRDSVSQDHLNKLNTGAL